jgi:hypothetical protein
MDVEIILHSYEGRKGSPAQASADSAACSDVQDTAQVIAATSQAQRWKCPEMKVRKYGGVNCLC